MRTVSAAVDVEATPEAVFAELSPASIIEYERTYDVSQVTETDDGWVLTAVSADPEIEMDLRFTERPDGFAYELLGGGPFEELYTTLTVHGQGTDAAEQRPVRVTMTSEYTLGGWLSPVVDWLASGNRERELGRALLGLAEDAGTVADEPDD